jgi:hypothetical protein
MNKLLLAPILVLMLTVNAAGQSSWIWVAPDEVISQSERTIEFAIETAPSLEGVKAIHLDIDFDPAIVSPILDQVALGSIFAPDDTITFIDVYLTPDGGRLSIDIAVLTDSVTVDGPGSVVVFPMVTDANGITILTISTVDVRDRFGNPIPVQVLLDGWVKVCQFVGDVNASNNIDVTDVTYLVSYLWEGGPAPAPMLSGDTDCSGEPDFPGPVNVADLTTLVAYLWQGGTLCAECFE